jgi:hypothetical protein
MEKQVRETYYKAYRGALEEQLVQKNYDWVCKLHRELVIRICAQIPKRADLHDTIAENMDPVLFKQQLENDCYKGDDFHKMVNYVYEWIKKLCSPARDTEVQASLDALYASMGNGDTFGKLVPAFIFGVHEHLDQIEQDKKEFLNKVYKHK